VSQRAAKILRVSAAILVLAIVVCIAALVWPRQEPPQLEGPLQLECMKRFDIDSYRVGCWLWGDHRPGGGAYHDEDFVRLRRAGFNTFIGSGGDLPLVRKHGLKIMLGAWKANLSRLTPLHEKFGDNPDVLGYHLNDNCDLHDYTVECARWLEKNAPGKLPWMSTSPNPVAQSRVPMPVISSQIYTFTQRQAEPQEQVRIWFCDTLDRDRAHCNRYNMAMWPIAGAYAHSETPSQYRFQANAAVAYGAQSVWLFAYNRYFRLVLNRAAGPANHYIADVAGPKVLGRRSAAVYHSGPDLPASGERPGPGKLIARMDDYLLAGVLVPDAKFRAGIDAPDYVMVVDKRTVKWPGPGVGGWTGGHSDAEPRPKWVDERIDNLYEVDAKTVRRPRITFGGRVRAVEALLPNGKVKRYEMKPGDSIQLPPLRGGAAILLRIDAKPVKLAQAIAGTKVWTVPNKWKFSLDPQHAAQKEKWAAPGFDDSKWKEILTDKYCGWKFQGYGTARGDGWYRLRLTVPSELRHRHLYFHFGAADEEAWVYIDGRLAFEHTRRSTKLGLGGLWMRPFFFDCRRFLAGGKQHTIAVKVYNAFGAGGLYRPIHLIGSDEPLDRRQLWELTKTQSK